MKIKLMLIQTRKVIVVVTMMMMVDKMMVVVTMMMMMDNLEASVGEVSNEKDKSGFGKSKLVASTPC